MMKMILILTNKDDVTSDFIVRELQRQKTPYYRLNTEDIPSLIEIQFNINQNSFILFDTRKNITIDLDSVVAVYYRRTKVSLLEHLSDTSSDEKEYLRGELAYILEGIYKILQDKYWLNNVYRIREAENKLYQLQIARSIGFSIPQSIITNKASMVSDLAYQFDNDCIIKPIKSGHMPNSTANNVIFTSKVNESSIQSEKRIVSFPVFIQNNIRKKYDLRCIVVGDNLYCARIDSQVLQDSKIDWRRSSIPLKHTTHDLPSGIAYQCIQITRHLGLNYSAIDLVLDYDGRYVFLECNPNGQWAWLEMRLGFPISKSIVGLLVKGFQK